MTTYAELYKSRCQGDKPTFWIPRPLSPVSPCLFGDETLTTQPEWNVEPSLQRCIALALQLELPVGEWVGSFTKTEKEKISPEQSKLLLSNIKDETFHLKGFQFAAEALPISQDILNESYLIGKAWEELDCPTIAKAGYAEMGVFMLTLAIMRLAGGTALADLSQKVAEDESRHVATNRAVMKEMSIAPDSPSSPIASLIDDTISWVVGDLNIPGEEICEDFDFDADFIRESSNELIRKGKADRLNELMSWRVHSLPFELQNSILYSRAVID